jgi:hypothetical protein
MNLKKKKVIEKSIEEREFGKKKINGHQKKR